MYECIVTQLKNVRPHPDAQKIQLASASGFQVVVGLEAKDDDIVLLFIDDGRLSEKYAYENNLFSKPELNKDKTITGYFGSNARIKAQKFRGEKSEAYTASLKSLEFTGYDISKLNVGDRFNELNGIVICEKYFTEATKKSQCQSKEKSSKKINEELRKLFPEHKDTDQFRFALDHQLKGLVTLTRKKHGTSFRVGYLNVPIEKKIKWYHALWNIFVILCYTFPRLSWEKEEAFKKTSFFFPEIKHEWRYIHGTRRVNKGFVNPNAQDYRSLSAMSIVPYMKKGEIWYGEILGYEENGRPIMGTVDTSKMGKEFVKRFGKLMTYKYGCCQGTWKIEIYRITQTLPDGSIIDLPWSMVKDRCNSSGIKHVPEIECDCINADHIERLKEVVEYHTEKVDLAEPDDPSHIFEGIVIRIDSFENGSMKLWKNKTFCFKVLEGIIKDSGVIDSEEQEAEYV